MECKVRFADEKLREAFYKLRESDGSEEIEVIAIILDWMNHKEYERLFKF